MTAIGHIILNVSDFERSRQFHDALMAQLNVAARVVHDGDDIKIVAYQIRGCPLYFRWARDETPLPFTRNVGIDHFCVAVESRAAVDEVWRLLERMSAIVTRAPRAYPEYTDSYYAVYFRDPDGFPFEVAFI